MHLWDYLLQSVIHSLIALLLVEASLRIWGVRQARERFRYRLQILSLPLLIAPLSQWITPSRGSLYFALDTALFSSAGWLRLDYGGFRPVFWVVVAVMAGTSLLTLHQEIIPILRRIASRTPEETGLERAPELEAELAQTSRLLQIRPPAVYLVDGEGPPMFISGARDPAIYLSRDLLESLQPEQLKSALIHELAHIARRSTATTVIVFLARAVMFYNPVSLIVFRRLIQDDEQICDEVTVNLTRDAGALASLLTHFLAERLPQGAFRFSGLRETIARDSHNLVLEERIASLKRFPGKPQPEAGWAPWLATATAVFAFGYLVV